MDVDEAQDVAFTVKELLLELRQDVKAIDSKLDQKADRERVHDLAATVASMMLSKADRADVRTLELQVKAMETMNAKILGGLAVVAAIAGTVLARLLGAF